MKSEDTIIAVWNEISFWKRHPSGVKAVSALMHCTGRQCLLGHLDRQTRVLETQRALLNTHEGQRRSGEQRPNRRKVITNVSWAVKAQLDKAPEGSQPATDLCRTQEQTHN